jgi:hypothetical protein
VILVRIRLLAPLAGNPVGAVLDHDTTAVGWLIGVGLAETVQDEPDHAPTTGDQVDVEGRPDTPSARRTRTRNDD